jgi:toxin ParE1/3/4
MRIRYTATAFAELGHILSYIANDNPLAAEEVATVIRATIARLAEYPRMAIETDFLGARVSPVLPYRYLVFYNIDEECVIIRNIRHAARARSG